MRYVFILGLLMSISVFSASLCMEDLPRCKPQKNDKKTCTENRNSRGSNNSSQKFTEVARAQEQRTATEIARVQEQKIVVALFYETPCGHSNVYVPDFMLEQTRPSDN